MNKKFVVLFMVFTLLGCSTSISPNTVVYLNGDALIHTLWSVHNSTELSKAEKDQGGAWEQLGLGCACNPDASPTRP